MQVHFKRDLDRKKFYADTRIKTHDHTTCAFLVVHFIPMGTLWVDVRDLNMVFRHRRPNDARRPRACPWTRPTASALTWTKWKSAKPSDRSATSCRSGWTVDPRSAAAKFSSEFLSRSICCCRNAISSKAFSKTTKSKNGCLRTSENRWNFRETWWSLGATCCGCSASPISSTFSLQPCTSFAPVPSRIPSAGTWQMPGSPKSSAHSSTECLQRTGKINRSKNFPEQPSRSKSLTIWSWASLSSSPLATGRVCSATSCLARTSSPPRCCRCCRRCWSSRWTRRKRRKFSTWWKFCSEEKSDKPRNRFLFFYFSKLHNFGFLSLVKIFAPAWYQPMTTHVS